MMEGWRDVSSIFFSNEVKKSQAGMDFEGEEGKKFD